MRSTIIQSFKSRAFPLLFLSVILTLIFVLFVVLSPKNARAEGFIPAPTLISVKDGAALTNQKPVITGLTINGTRVDIFIDGNFDGAAAVRDHESGTASFSYTPKNSLAPGFHVISALSAIEDNMSQEEIVNIQVIGFVPPTLFIPVFNLETLESRPFITGVAKNNSLVKIYLDGQYDGEIWVKNHPSGTPSFRYQPKRDLKVNMHQVRAIAVNRLTGQESINSNIVTFKVNHPYPAPTLFTPNVNNASWSRPNITGVAKNGSHVDIYINNVKHRVNLKAHPSGTTYFSFRPETNLPPKNNVIFSVAYSNQGRLSRKSNLIYWDLTPAGQKTVEEPLIVEEPEVIEPEISIETPEDTIAKVEEPKETPDIEIDIEDRSDEAEVTIEEEPDVSEKDTEVTDDADDADDADKAADDTGIVVGEEESGEGPNWSKVIGLIILAVLIIALIIQLLRKEEPEEEKKKQTMDLFGQDKKDEKESKKTDKESKKENKNTESDSDKKDDIPPPPPPSSNLPF